MRKTLTIGPFPFVFSNENDELEIPLHHHHAELRLSYAFSSNAGFPVLAHTMDLVADRLEALVRHPFMNTRNEDLLEIIYRSFRDWEPPEEITRLRGDRDLVAVELTVLGIRDSLGHAAGPATYRLEA